LSYPKHTVKHHDITDVSEMSKINDITTYLLTFKRTEAKRMVKANQFEICRLTLNYFKQADMKKRQTLMKD